MRIYKKLFILIAILPKVLISQYYTSGADPASIKWNRIETKNFRVVFPREFTEKGQYVAKILEEVYKYGGNSLQHKPRRINVLVHSETAYSNGFVSWAPKRIELYNNPNQHMYAQDWLQQLALHEFRHVVQLDKLNDGFTKMLSYILGEQAVGASLGLFVPMWFLEGDAVVAETALTKSGRGRSPWFEQGIRAQIMDKRLYSYEKAMFGSYRDYVPNHYEMGYQLVAGARARYGSDVWEKALYHTGRNPLAITPFNQGQKKVTSLNKVDLYQSTFGELKQQWERQDSVTQKSGFEDITKLSMDYVNYQYPVALGQDSYAAELSGPGEVSRFVSVDKGGEVRDLFVPGSRNNEPFSYANQTLCWAELEPDPRWENRMFSVIKCYHLPTQKITKITRKSRYLSPALSSDGRNIVAVRVDNRNNYRLVILDKKTGTVLRELQHGNNNYLFTPSWSMDGTKIVCIALSSEGKEIAMLDLENEEWERITEPSFQDISLPKWGMDNEILFTAGYSGTEEIYSVKNGEISQVTQSKYGSTGAIMDGNVLVYCNYTANGYQLVMAKKQEVLNIPLNNVNDYSVKLHEVLSAQEMRKPEFSSVDTVSDYEVKKYSKWNLLNFHSWAPGFINVNDEQVGAGVTALSQNLLGTASTSLGLNADAQKSLEKYYFNFKYQGWYPVIDLEVKHGDDRIKYTDNDDTIAYRINQKRIQTEVKLDISLPFNLTRGKYSTYLQPSIGYGVLKRTGYDIDVVRTAENRFGREVTETDIINVPDIAYRTLEYSLYFHRLLRRSERDVTTRWGQIAQVLYQSTPWGNMDAGGILGLYSRVYLPGFMKHHSIRVDNSYQHKTMGDEYEDGGLVLHQTLGNYFSAPRGYNSKPNDRMYSFKGDYIFPVCNPDLNLSGVIYLKRVTANLFYDYSRTFRETEFTSGEIVDVNKNFSSTGFELRGEVHACRFMFPFTVGYRYARLLETNQNKHEFLLGINISGFSIGH
ncbi:TolB family protein [Saccharicrinis sp. 156]|uniref:TolB family protein n=1 Tax=Saccharicrinis sp. 156 TaxID=3417574 RepID=UPI003D33406E